jgi:hypothetical protein
VAGRRRSTPASRARFKKRGARARAPTAALSSRLKGSRGIFAAGCAVCGEPLDGREPFWVTAYPEAVHERCLDWRRRPFPYERQLQVLARAARGTTDPVARRLLEAGRAWLVELRDRWSEDATAELVAEANARLRELRGLCLRSGVDESVRRL